MKKRGLRKDWRRKRTVTPAKLDKQGRIVEPERVVTKTELWLVPK
jgi:hypothetical protein